MTVASTSVTVVRNWRDFCPYAEESLPFVFRPCPGVGQGESRADGSAAHANGASTQGAPAATSLPLFGSIARDAVLHESLPRMDAGSGPAAIASEVVLVAGGPVWSLHWHPHPPFFHGEPLLSLQLLALSAHRVTSPFNVEGKRQHGPALIQIWEVPVAPLDPPPADPALASVRADAGGSRQPAGQDVDDQARMVLGIAHRGGMAWDVKWHPGSGAALARTGTPDMVAVRPKEKGHGDGAAFDPCGVDGQGAASAGPSRELQLPSWGMLAAALADGTVQVYVVPEPQSLLDTVSECEPAVPWARVPVASSSPFGAGDGLDRDYGDLGVDGEDPMVDGDGDTAMFDFSQPLLVDMAPLFVDDSRSTVASGPCVLTWSPLDPHDVLLGGCGDGTVIVWKLPSLVGDATASPPAGASLTRLMKVMCDEEPVRAICWLSTDSCHPSDMPLIAVGGAKAGVRFWDLREPHRLLWDWKKSVPGTVRALKWIPGLRALALALDEGGLRFGMLATANAARARSTCAHDRLTSWGGTRYLNLTDSTTVWDVDVVPGSGLGACCCGDGTTWLFQVHSMGLRQATSKRNPVQVFACSTLEWKGVTLSDARPLASPHDAQGSAEQAAQQLVRQLSADGPLVLSLEVNEGLLPPPPEPRFARKDKPVALVARGSFPYRHEQALYKVAWAPLVTSPSTGTNAVDSESTKWPLMFAQGGGAGLVRCITLKV